MRKRLYILVFVLLISSKLSVGKDRNKTKNVKGSHKIQHAGHSKTESDLERIKRSLNDEDDRPFWANRGKKQSEEEFYNGHGYENYKTNNKILKASEKIIKEPPFWGNRGRRGSSSLENFLDNIEYQKNKCQNCKDHFYTPLVHDSTKNNFMDRRIDTPFWGNRGRRNSDQVSADDDDGTSSPFWGNRGRRHEDEPFWGNRGRRDIQSPSWDNRGEQENALPFWGNRGRRTQLSRFANWAREEDSEPFWGNRGRRKDLKDSIRNAINVVEDEIVNISHMRGISPVTRTSFWKNEGRNSVLKHIFSGIPRSKNYLIHPTKKATEDSVENRNDAKTAHEDAIYADEPHYILVERSSRSSSEEDPFYISRGKKVLNNLDLAKAARDRRGAIEEIFKSVKNDPYFIVRGKKDFGETNTKVNASLQDKVTKAKDFICATWDIIMTKPDASRVKREAGESDRGRRATLKKLAAQLQIDPYFISRGKKSSDRMVKGENYEEFINHISDICN